MSMTMEQVITQLQQELFTLIAQVAAESGLADAVRAINNLATAQVRKDMPSLIDVEGLGRPKKFVVDRRLSRVMRRMKLSPTRGRIRRRHGEDCKNDMIRRQEEGNETFCARSFLLDGAFFWNSKRGSNAGSPTCLAMRRR